ncbi:hypothetical protein Mar181_0957 [Marinomonas posidonica IVIA-Po-181]|uniref:Uncharacterized protein n=1 Tax=Marinomonas posidonica (strain CECT 7376 / NCIMB 14433 / IVIA-Po-181) TaxID=491952 RepID=F6CTF7_MARPP|nr:hypothetical protein Mar181_0957 [Marinomonas posidonica IVIA-Po-181]
MVFTVILIMITVSGFIFFVRWKQKQDELRKRQLGRLSSRGEKMLRTFSMLSDRYFLKETKLFLIEYLLSVIQQLKQAGINTEFIHEQYNLTKLYTEITSGKNVSDKRRVNSQVEFEQTQSTLQFLIKELRSLLDGNSMSRVMIRHHIGLVRFSYSLAYRDHLVGQAKQDLEHEHKSRALEKYRLALAVMEKHSVVGLARKEASRLQNMILDVEDALLEKKEEHKK